MKRLIYAALFFFISHTALAENDIQLMTEEFAPYQYYDDTVKGKPLTGISIEIVKAVQEKVGNTSPIKLVPWSRGLKILNTRKNSALFSTARTPERESKYKWVGPLANLEMVFFKKKGSDVSFTSMEEAKKVGKIGVTKNVATHEILSHKGFTNLDVSQSGADERNLKRLIKGRIDVWPTAYFAGIYSAKKTGVLGQVEAIPNVTILSGHLYIAFNKETDDAIIFKWQSALDQLRSDGVLDKIIARYDR